MRGVAAFTGAILLYAALSISLMLDRPYRYELMLLLIQYAVLLPAAVYFLRSWSWSADDCSVPRPSVKLLAAAFLLAAVPLSWVATRGLLISDESAYRFQSQVFRLGRLAATSPPGATSDPTGAPKPLYFEHHIIDGSRWFVKYPWGWPAVLAIGAALHADYLVNPLLGLLLLALTWRIARVVFGKDTAALAALIAALSPFVVANSIGLMSHTLCGVLIAAACLLCFHGLRTQTTMPFAGMFFLIALACHVRPFTAAVLGFTLGLSTLWYLRAKRRLFIRVAGAGLGFAGITAASVVLYNSLYTGTWWRSPYALAVGAAAPHEITLNAERILANAFITRWAVQDTLVFIFPLLPLVAVYALCRDKAHMREVRILAALFPALIAAYLVQTQTSASFNGERYYFEGFFAFAILGARGIVLLAERWRIPRGACIVLLASAAGLLVIQQAAAARIVFELSYPYRQVRAQAERAQCADCVIFLRETDDFTAKHFNLNSADWNHAAAVYLVDPGPVARDAWAARFNRPEWIVIGYDSERQVAAVVARSIEPVRPVVLRTSAHK